MGIEIERGEESSGLHTIKVTVKRYHPGVDIEPYDMIYEVPVEKTISVSQCLRYINQHYDGSLAHYLSCRRGVCSGCTARVDGNVVRPCVYPVKGDFRIEAVRMDRVIKDLVTKL